MQEQIRYEAEQGYDAVVSEICSRFNCESVNNDFEDMVMIFRLPNKVEFAYQEEDDWYARKNTKSKWFKIRLSSGSSSDSDSDSDSGWPTRNKENWLAIHQSLGRNLVESLHEYPNRIMQNWRNMDITIIGYRELSPPLGDTGYEIEPIKYIGE